MIHELREYYIAPGKAVALHSRFEKLTMPFFKKHDIKVIGFWNVMIGENPKLVYICEFNDLSHYEKAWNSFMSDPEWISGKGEYEKEGALTIRTVSSVMTPTSYSPLK